MEKAKLVGRVTFQWQLVRDIINTADSKVHFEIFNNPVSR